MAAFATTAIPHPRACSQGGSERALCTATALTTLQGRQEQKEGEHSSFPSHSTAGCDPHKIFLPYIKQKCIFSELPSMHRCTMEESTDLLFSTTCKDLYFWKNKRQGKRATGLFWIALNRSQKKYKQINQYVDSQDTKSLYPL